MKSEYIDVHAHINFPAYDADRHAVIKRARDAGVLMINVGTTLATSQDIVDLAEKNDGVYAIVGQHPTHDEVFDYDAFEKLVAHPKVVGVGECGIDVFRLPEGADREAVLKQQEADFRKQIELAVKYDKPLMIHARESYSQILGIIDDSLRVNSAQLRGNAHFFAGTIEEAQAFLDRGFTLSFTGVITFAKQYEELVRYVPLDKMLSETDCPFVTPVPFRGQRNEPIHVREVVQKIALIKGLNIEIVKKALLDNAFKQFRLS